MIFLSLINWGKLGNIPGCPWASGLRDCGKNKLTHWDVQNFVEQILESYSRYYSVSYGEFAEVFYKYNAELDSEIKQLFKNKTGIFKGQLRINSYDTELHRILMEILIPAVDRVENAFEEYKKLNNTQRTLFWMALHRNADLIGETRIVVNMCHSLTYDEEKRFIERCFNEAGYILLNES